MRILEILPVLQFVFRRTISVDIMETLVVMESVYKVEERKCIQFHTCIVNRIFGQKWSVDRGEDEEENDDDEGVNNDEKERVSIDE